MSRYDSPASVVDHAQWPFYDPDAPADMLDTPEIHEDPAVRALVLARHAALVAKLRRSLDTEHAETETALAIHRGYQCVAAYALSLADAADLIASAVRMYEAAGYRCIVKSAPYDVLTLNVWVRSLAADDGALARYREAGDNTDDDTTET